MKDKPIPKQATKAEQLLAIEMFSNLLVSVKPEDIGKKLTDQIRELTGAETVILFNHNEAGHEVLSACPERRRNIFSHEALDILCLGHNPHDTPFNLAMLENEHPVKKVCQNAGVTSLIRVPLAAFNELVATLAVCNLHNIERLEETYELLVSLAPVVALALRNALNTEKIETQSILLQKQATDLEARVLSRTAELEKANRALELSRIAALNMMQDSIDAQQRTEEAIKSLHESRALYEDVVKYQEIGIYRLRWVMSDKNNPYSFYEFFNDRYCDLSGFSREELAADSSLIISTIHPDDQARFDEKNASSGVQNSVFSWEGRMRLKGNYRWVHIESVPRTVENGDIIWTGTFNDITERKESEEALRATNALNEAILSNSPIGISVRGSTGQLLSYNDAWKKIWNMTDKTLEDDKNKKRDTLHFDERDAYFKPYQEQVRAIYQSGGYLFIPEMKTSKTKNGYPLWLSQHFYAILDLKGEVDRVVVLTEDISERKKSEDALRESEAKFRSYIEHSPIAMFLTDSQGRYTKVNKAASDMLGYTHDELCSLSISDLLTPEHMIYAETFNELKKNGIMSAEIQLQHKNGVEIPIHISAVKLSDNEFMAFCADISGIKKAEDALRKSEERHRVLYETMSQGVVYHNLHGEIEFSNAAAQKILGLSQDELDGRTALDPRWKTIHEDGSPFPGNEHPAMIALKTGEPISNVTIGVYHPKDDRTAWVLVSAVPYFDPHTRKLTGSYAVFTDITENKKAEDAIALSEKKYRMLFKEMLNGFALHEIICNEDGIPVDYRFLEINPAFELLTGLSAKNLVGKTVKDVLPGTEAFWIERYGRVALTGEPDMFMQYTEPLDRYYEVLAYCPERGTFAVIFNDVSERTKAEIIVRENEARLTRAEYVSESGNWEVDLNKKAVYASKGARRVYGVGSENLTLSDIQKIPMNKYREKMDRAFQELITHMTPYDIEFQIRRPDTDEIRDIHSIAEFDAQKNIVFGVIQDVTARKKAEEEIKLYFDVSIDLLSIANFEGFFTRVNPTWTKIMGWTDEELYHESFIGFVHEDDRDSTVRMVESLMRGEGVVGFDNRYRTKDGSYRWLSWNAFALLDRKIIMAVARDVTEKKLSEEILRSNEERLRSALDSANDSFYDWNLITKKGYYNPRLYDILGYTTDEFPPDYDRFVEYIHPEDLSRIEQYDTEYLQNPTGQYDVEFRMRCKDDTYKWIRSRGKVVEFTEDGKPKRLTGIHSDVTVRKRHEEELRALNDDLEQRVAQRTAELSAYNKELEAFSYSVSHDLRSPLRSINGFSQVLYEEYAALMDDSGRDYLRRIMLATQRMGVLIDDLLNLSRITRYDMQRTEVDLAHYAHAVIDELQAGDRDRHVNIYIESPMIEKTDEHLIRIVLQNLIGNAWKFTSKIDDPEIRFYSTTIDGEHVYVVRDNGAGFDMAYVDKLFGVFQRLHTSSEFPGTGVGLAIVQRIISRHNGRVWADSEIGKGASFYFTLGEI